MTRNHVFSTLRGLVLNNSSRALPVALAARTDLIPIEGTVDGCYCLRSDLRVVHVETADPKGEEQIEPASRATAMVGTLIREFPLATALLRAVDPMHVCRTCRGTGRVPGLPPELLDSVRCECGGLGWITEDGATST